MWMNHEFYDLLNKHVAYGARAHSSGQWLKI